jgi:MFS family permease
VAQPAQADQLTRTAFYASRLTAQMGQGLFLAALLLSAGKGGSAATGLSSVLVAMMAAAILLSIPGGTVADRLGPARGLALGSMLRLSAITGSLLVLGRPDFAWVVAFFYSAASQIFSSSEMALVPAVRTGCSGKAHSILVTLQHSGQAVAIFVLAPALYFAGGLGAMVAAAIVAYCCVLGIALFLAYRLGGTRFARPEHEAKRASLAPTLRFLSRDPRAIWAVGLLVFAELAMKSTAVSLPLYFKEDLRLADWQTVALIATGLVGLVIGLAWAGRTLTMNLASRAMRAVMVITVFSVLALAGLSTGLQELAAHSQIEQLERFQGSLNMGFAVALPVALLMGLCLSIAPVTARTVLSETAPRGHHGRVFATQGAFTDLVLVLPLLLAGFGTDFAGARVTFLCVGTVGTAVFLMLERMGPLSSHLQLPLAEAPAATSSSA